MRYWQRVFASVRGELWFGAHARAAPEEMRSLAGVLLATLNARRKRIPALVDLLEATRVPPSDPGRAQPSTAWQGDPFRKTIPWGTTRNGCTRFGLRATGGRAGQSRPRPRLMSFLELIGVRLFVVTRRRPMTADRRNSSQSLVDGWSVMAELRRVDPLLPRRCRMCRPAGNRVAFLCCDNGGLLEPLRVEAAPRVNVDLRQPAGPELGSACGRPNSTTTTLPPVTTTLLERR